MSDLLDKTHGKKSILVSGTIKIIKNIDLFVCTHVSVPRHACHVEDDNLEAVASLSLSPMWHLESELKSPGRAASTVTHGAISLTSF